MRIFASILVLLWVSGCASTATNQATRDCYVYKTLAGSDVIEYIQKNEVIQSRPLNAQWYVLGQDHGYIKAGCFTENGQRITRVWSKPR